MGEPNVWDEDIQREYSFKINLCPRMTRVQLQIWLGVHCSLNGRALPFLYQGIFHLLHRKTYLNLSYLANTLVSRFSFTANKMPLSAPNSSFNCCPERCPCPSRVRGFPPAAPLLSVALEDPGLKGLKKNALNGSISTEAGQKCVVT